MSNISENNFPTRNYYLDIVFCIDCTGSMAECLDSLKKQYSRLFDYIVGEVECRGRSLRKCRISIIAFRDVSIDGKEAFHDSGFYVLPEETEQLLSFVESLTAHGGGEEIEESGLEALAIAMNSDWQKHEFSIGAHNTYRHLIVIMSDAPTHALGYGKNNNVFYPSNMPINFDELYDMWEEKMPKGKRLILLTPDTNPWTEVGMIFNSCIHYPGTIQDINKIDLETLLTGVY